MAGTLSSNSGAYFEGDEVRVRVASNTDCTNAGTDVDELISMINPAINDYWNTVPTSRLKLVNGGRFETTDVNFNTGVLCTEQTDDPAIECTGVGTEIPKVTDIVIACNSLATNYTNSGGSVSGTLAVALSNNIDGALIAGSVILINNDPLTPFNGQSFRQKIAILSHEIGHAVGLGHITDPANIMFFTPTPERFALGRDDAQALTYLYPKRFDGCGLFGTIKQVEDDSSGNTFLFQILFGFLLAFLMSRLSQVRFK